MVMKIVEEIKRYILELGNDGRLISMQLNELIRYIERDGILLIRDYCKEDSDYNEIYKEIQKLKNSTNQKKVAQAIAKAFNKYITENK